MEKQTLNPPLNPLAVRGTNQIFRAIAHPLRLRIVQFIDTEATTPVHKIFTGLGIEQSLASQHLRILRNAELVHAQRDGKSVLYSLNYKKISTVVGFSNDLMGGKKKNA